MIEHEKSVAVCSVRNPLDPGLWSRTPYNVCRTLKERGRLGPAIFGLNHKGLRIGGAIAATAIAHGKPTSLQDFAVGTLPRLLHGQQIVRQIRRLKTRDVLHFCCDRYFPLPSIPPGTRHYLMIDGTWNDWEHPRLQKKFELSVDRALGKGYRQMDHIFPIGEWVCDSLVEHYGVDPERITVVGSGTGIIEPFRGEKNYRNDTILFAAKERFADKGGALLLEGFRIAQAKKPSLQLWIVGDESLREAERTTPNLKVFSFLPLEELQRLFNEASLYAMPAPLEPWGLVYLEALGCKMPILGLNRRAFPELAGGGKYGFVLSEPTPERIASTLLDAFSDYDRLERMGSAGQQRVLEWFTWGAVADRILQTIDTIAAAPAAAMAH
jgi:glycosyltransferase involved in cell wall biosynthesis